MIVYARKDKTYIWNDNNGTHKAGWVPLFTPLVTGGEKPAGWYAIARPIDLSLSPDPIYPEYWVKVGDTTEATDPTPEPTPEPTPGEVISDAQAAVSIIALLKWWKQR